MHLFQPFREFDADNATVMSLWNTYQDTFATQESLEGFFLCHFRWGEQELFINLTKGQLNL